MGHQFSTMDSVMMASIFGGKWRLELAVALLVGARFVGGVQHPKS